jgi:hypothetical protein
MEYILAQQNAVDKRVANQWLRGIKSSTKKRAIVERWRSTASKFTLDEGFKEFYEQAIRENQAGKSTLEQKDGR